MAAKLADSVDAPVTDAIGVWRLSVRDFRVALGFVYLEQFWCYVRYMTSEQLRMYTIRVDRPLLRNLHKTYGVVVASGIRRTYVYHSCKGADRYPNGVI